MTTQKYKSLLVIIWALWAFHPCLAIDDVLRTAKRDAILEEFYKLKYCSTVVYMVPRA